MLVLTVKTDEALVIEEQLTGRELARITIERSSSTRVRLAIDSIEELAFEREAIE